MQATSAVDFEMIELPSNEARVPGSRLATHCNRKATFVGSGFLHPTSPVVVTTGLHLDSDT